MELFENGIVSYVCKQVKMVLFGFGCVRGIPECR